MKDSKIVDRRDFIKQSSILASIAFLPNPISYLKNERKYKLGLQTFTIRDAMEKDLIETLKTVKSLGYEDLELYSFNAERMTYFGVESSMFKEILDDIGLSASSCHYGFSDYLEKSDDDLKKIVDSCIVGAKTLKTKYITWPWIHPKYRNANTFKKLPDILNRIGNQVSQANLGFAYHNHDFEFHDYNGKTGYEIILEGTNPKTVKLQLDLYWAIHSSKLKPEELIAKDPERFVMWHIKDMDKITRDYSELGNGSIDYISLLPKLNKTGLEYYYLEQGGNFTKNPIQSITESVNYFKSNLQHYL